MDEVFTDIYADLPLVFYGVLGNHDQAIADLDAYDWIVFTSVNGVDAFFSRLESATESQSHGELFFSVTL